MSSWEYQDDSGDKLVLDFALGLTGVHLSVDGDTNVHIKQQDAPGVAQAILAFSHAKATVVEGKLPEATIEEVWKGQLHAVVRDENGIVCQWEVRRENIEHARRCALDALAIAAKIEEYLDSEEHAAKVLLERQCALLTELRSGARESADTQINYAINRIIELENKLAAKEAEV